MSCGAASSYLAYLVKFDEIHLELADLRVKGERVKEHRADESYVSRLAEKKRFSPVYGENSDKTCNRSSSSDQSRAQPAWRGRRSPGKS